MCGGFFVSYARAKAEAIGIKCLTGILERPERIILISFGCIIGRISIIIWIMLILTYFTVLQRIFWVYKNTRNDYDEGD